MHPLGDLSAYLDGALSSEASASVQAHLDTCADCRTRLRELRGTARLIAALPMPVPSRSLVPRVSVPFWLAPLRTLSTVASGAAIFLFLASAVLSSFPRAVGTGAGGAAAPAAAPAPNTAGAPQQTGGAAADSATGPSGEFKAASPSPASAPAPGTERSTGSVTPTPPESSAEAARREAAARASSNPVEDQSTRLNANAEPAPFAILASPWLWLFLGIAFAGLSFILGRRLRST